MKTEIEHRFQDNLTRVMSLVDLYSRQAPNRRGRAPVMTADLLRAAVVFLHATLEDLLRSSLDWKLPSAAPEHLRLVPLVGVDKGGREPRCDLSDLAMHRGKTVAALLAESVSAHLEASNFNNPGQVQDVLTKLGLDSTIILDPHKPENHRVKSISPGTVADWHTRVREFGEAFLAAL